MTGDPERPDGLPTRGTTPLQGPDDAARKVPEPPEELSERPATLGTPGLPGDVEPGAHRSGPDAAPSASTDRTTVQWAALVVAAVFALVGVLGFVPGVTTNFGDLGFAGHASEAMLLGLFQVSILHNLVHVLFAVAGFAMARTPAGARGFLVGGGVIYLVLWLYGLVIDPDSALNFVPLNGADNWLHLVLGVGMVALGVLLGRTRMRS
jgi:hypothetical protein